MWLRGPHSRCGRAAETSLVLAGSYVLNYSVHGAMKTTARLYGHRELVSPFGDGFFFQILAHPVFKM